MKRKQKMITSFVVTTATVFSCANIAFAINAQNEEDIVILSTNDVHCGISDHIGYDGLALYKKEMQQQYKNVVLVDAGDAIQGAPIGTLSKGQYVLDVMKEVNYDVNIPGNHEFDYGMDRFKEINAMFKNEHWTNGGYISANISYKGNKMLDPYRLITINTNGNEKKIAFVGVTTPESLIKSTPVYFQEDGKYVYSFDENDKQALYKDIQDSVNDARKEADYVVIVGHLGEEGTTAGWQSKDIVENTKGVDALIDGHSHETFNNKTAKNLEGKNVPITQTGTKLENIGKMTIDLDSNGKINGITTENVKSVPAPTGTLATEATTVTRDKKQVYVDKTVNNAINTANAKVDAELSKKIGETSFKLYDKDPITNTRLVRNHETNVGNLVADGFKNVLGADCALLNGGGIRASIEAGDITYKDAMTVSPFNNMGCVGEVSGEQIADLIELGTMDYPNENGSFPNVSGITYTIDPFVASNVKLDDKGRFIKVDGARRVKDIKINGEPIDFNKTYKLATHNYFMKNGGDGYIISGKCKVIKDEVMADNEILATYIRDYLHGVVPDSYKNPYGEGRIHVVTQNEKDLENALEKAKAELKEAQQKLEDAKKEAAAKEAQAAKELAEAKAKEEAAKKALAEEQAKSNKLAKTIAANKKKLTKTKVTGLKVSRKRNRKFYASWKVTKYASKYQVAYRKKGAKKWTYKTVSKCHYTSKKLKKGKYSIKIRGIDGKTKGKFSSTKTLKVR